MKKIIITLAAAFMMGATAVKAQDDNKQDQRRPKFDKTEMAKKRTEDMAQKYKLTEEQTAKLLELNQKFADKTAPGHHPRGPRNPHQGAKPSRGQHAGHGHGKDIQRDSLRAGRPPRAEMGQAMKEYDAELQKILTTEQYQNYQNDRKKQRPQGPHHPHNGGKDKDKTE